MNVAYKGFAPGMRCRGKQYAIGGEYTHAGAVEGGYSGLHACTFPLDVLGWMPPSCSLYAIVEQGGVLSPAAGDSTIASSKLTIRAEIGVDGLIKAAMRSATSVESRTGSCSVAINADERSAATNVGERSVAANTGDEGAAANTGARSISASVGDCSVATAGGGLAAAVNTGYKSIASAAGESSIAANIGEYGLATSTGTRSAAISVGGDAMATGDRSVAIATGSGGRVAGGDGCALFLVERDEEGKIIAAWAGIVGLGGIKPGTFYALVGGTPAEEAVE